VLPLLATKVPKTDEYPSTSAKFSPSILLRTNLFKATWEKGPARNMNYHITDEMSKSVFKSAGFNRVLAIEPDKNTPEVAPQIKAIYLQ